jgi:hypothetical protein
MGDIADMMLDGTLCATCGAAMDDVADDDFDAPGFPRYCSLACEPVQRSKVPPNPQPISAKLLRTLATAARKGQGSEYDGERWDSSPAQFAKLERRGLVESWQPHNPAHMPRAIATEAGRAALAKAAVKP